MCYDHFSEPTILVVFTRKIGKHFLKENISHSFAAADAAPVNSNKINNEILYNM